MERGRGKAARVHGCMGSRQSRQGRPDGLRGAPRERRDIEKGDIDMKCYECLQLTDKLRVGDYGFEIWAARHDKPKQMRVKRKYRRFCEWMAEKYRQPERWIEESLENMALAPRCADNRFAPVIISNNFIKNIYYFTI